METPFQERVVIVTGASTGIGAATAEAFAQAGAHVVVAARSEQQLQAVADAHNLLAVPADITSDADVERLVSTTITRYGRIDVLVNNAGFGIRCPVTDTPVADAQRLLDVNFFGLLRCTRAVLPHMKRQGTGQIVNVASVLAVVATPRNGVYCASKAAVRVFSEALRLEIRDAGIDVILIMPGYTATPFFENQLRYGGPVRLTPIKGQSPAKVAQVILTACAEKKREVALTFWGNLGITMKKLCPRLLDWSLGRGIS